VVSELVVRHVANRGKEFYVATVPTNDWWINNKALQPIYQQDLESPFRSAAQFFEGFSKMPKQQKERNSAVARPMAVPSLGNNGVLQLRPLR